MTARRLARHVAGFFRTTGRACRTPQIAAQPAKVLGCQDNSTPCTDASKAGRAPRHRPSANGRLHIMFRPTSVAMAARQPAIPPKQTNAWPANTPDSNPSANPSKSLTRGVEFVATREKVNCSTDVFSPREVTRHIA